MIIALLSLLGPVVILIALATLSPEPVNSFSDISDSFS
jgi:hypothetical protein